ncbi:hypothetical protein B0H11DRAFT_1938656 [Mycena galericulata]|nr:hypothetical protein B0H11DRAFT_1938656 [Mycena galericulata]
MSSRPAPTVYYCDCPVKCKRRKPVKRSTFLAHAPYRKPLSRTLEEHTAATFDQLMQNENATVGLTDSELPARMKPRLASPKLSDDPPPFTMGDSDGFGQQLPEDLDIPEPGSLQDPDQDEQEGPASRIPSPVNRSNLSPPHSPVILPEQPSENYPLEPAPPRPYPSIHEKLSAIDSIRTTQLFIRALEGASLDDSGLDADVVHRLRNPIQECVDIADDKDFHLSLDVFLADTYASEETYKATRTG